MSEKWLKVVCIKPITLDGDDDCMPYTQDYDVGDKHDHVSILDDGRYEFGYGTAWFWCTKEEFEQHFEILK